MFKLINVTRYSKRNGRNASSNDFVQSLNQFHFKYANNETFVYNFNKHYSTSVKRGVARPIKIVSQLQKKEVPMVLEKKPVPKTKPAPAVLTLDSQYEEHFKSISQKLKYKEDDFDPKVQQRDLIQEEKRRLRAQTKSKELSTTKEKPPPKRIENFKKTAKQEDETKREEKTESEVELKDDRKDKTKTVKVIERKSIWPKVEKDNKYAKLWKDYSSQANNHKFRQSKVMQVRDLALMGKAEEAIKVFEEMRKDSFEKQKISAFLFDQLILSCSRSGKWNRAFNLYNTMKKFQFKPSIKTMNILITCLSNVKYGKTEDPIIKTREKIEFIKNQMIKYDIQPTIREYNALFKALGNVGDLDGSLYIMDELFTNRKSEVKPDVTTFTILMENIGKKDLNQTFVIWDYMKDQTDVQPDTYLYNTILKVCNLNEKAELAIEIFNEMRENNIKPDKRTISMLATAYSKLGIPSQAPVLLHYINEWKISRDEFVENSIFRLGTMKKWNLAAPREKFCKSSEEFIDIFEQELLNYKVETSNRKLKPSYILLSNTEIEMFFIGSVNVSLLDRAMKYYNLIIERGIIPPVKYFDRFTSMCKKSNVELPQRPFREEVGPKHLQNKYKKVEQ